MITRIDHVTICVPDLEHGTAQLGKLGFTVYPGGGHPGYGVDNAIAFLDDDYIELAGLRDAAANQAAGTAPPSPYTDLVPFVAAGGGLRSIVLQSDDLAKDVAAMRGRGVDVGDATEGGRRTPGGQELKWKVAALGPRNPLPLYFVQHLTPIAERRKQMGAAARHPNGAYTLERAYIVTHNAADAAALYAKVLGLPQPPLQKGTVIMSNMAVFQLGRTGLGIVAPYAPGPAADALERRGPGPFQALYRTTSMSGAAKWMEEHGMPPLERGVRNTGEQAMLVPPAHACGAYIGFVGPE